jgi:hypothetical protein
MMYAPPQTTISPIVSDIKSGDDSRGRIVGPPANDHPTAKREGKQVRPMVSPCAACPALSRFNKSGWRSQRLAEEGDQNRSRTLKPEEVGVGALAYLADGLEASFVQHSSDSGGQLNLIDFRIVREVWGRIEQQVPISPSPSADLCEPRETRAVPWSGVDDAGLVLRAVPKDL